MGTCGNGFSSCELSGAGCSGAGIWREGAIPAPCGAVPCNGARRGWDFCSCYSVYGWKKGSDAVNWKSLWFRATSMAIFGRPTTYGFCLHFLCVCKEGMAGEEKKTRRFWDQTGVGKGDGRGEVKHRGMESPSLSSGHPFSGEKPACVCRSRLYEVVSSKDSWNNEANPSLYLMRMLFFVVVKWDYHLCLPKRRLCEFHVWGITYAGIVL